jgi:hypothetical protein
MATDFIKSKKESTLLRHIGHKIECVRYCNKKGVVFGTALECVDCNEVLYSEEFE